MTVLHLYIISAITTRAPPDGWREKRPFCFDILTSSPHLISFTTQLLSLGRCLSLPVFIILFFSLSSIIDLQPPRNNLYNTYHSLFIFSYSWQHIKPGTTYFLSSHKQNMEDLYSSSSSSASYLSRNIHEAKSAKQTPPHYSSLHSVRKAPAKPWKKPIAPLPPTPPRVYRVDPVNFRELVQKLTAGPEFVQARRLQSVAPPPLDVATPPPPMQDARTAAHLQLLRPFPTKPSFSTMYNEFSDTLEMKTQKVSDGTGFLGLNLSPSSYNWCSIPLLSPGTLSSLEQSTVL